MCVSVYSHQSLESHNVKLVAVSVFSLRMFYNSGHGYLYAGGKASSECVCESLR